MTDLVTTLIYVIAAVYVPVAFCSSILLIPTICLQEGKDIGIVLFGVYIIDNYLLNRALSTVFL